MVRTPTIIFTLFGGYIIPRGGEIWVGGLIELLKPFGFSENSVRLALSRMSKQGFICSRKIGRKSYYSLSEKGRQWMLKGKDWALNREYKSWDKKWRILIYNIPEDLRHLRDNLRKELQSLGFGSLGISVWISPYDIKEKLAKLFQKVDVADYVETFKGEYIGELEGQKLINKAWDIWGLEKRYNEFLNKYYPLLNEYKDKIKKKEVVDLGECFAKRFRLTTEYIEIALFDPMLPLELLPTQWAGLKAKNVCFEFRELLTPEANKFVDSIFRKRQQNIKEIG